jgi:Ca2+-binding RTX toxin-like protein
LNGTLVGENAYTGGLTLNNDPIGIGTSNADNPTSSTTPSKFRVDENFNGSIQQVAIYGEAVNAQQLAQLQQRGPVGAGDPNGSVIEVYASFLTTPGHIDTFSVASVSSIYAVLGDGDDVIDPTVSVPAYIQDGNGADQIFAGSGGTTIIAGNGNDVLVGGIGNDTITAGNGNDYIVGGGGNDVIKAGTGNNTLGMPPITPISYWSVNETSGAVINDATGVQNGVYVQDAGGNLGDAGPP